jgi:uncharacterized Rmd1/YagE family protein
MYCFATCTAQAYEIKPLFVHLNKKFTATLYQDAIHIKFKDGDAFFFSYGVIVFWGINKDDDKILMAEVEPFEDEPNDDIETDKFLYNIADRVKVQHAEIILPNQDPLTLLAVSHALAQSVKLNTFEQTVRTAVQSVGTIPQSLAKKGSIPLSRKEIRQKMGELFVDRSSINLHLDTLDVPEFFSEYPELESYYTMAIDYLELKQRIEVLNQRLDVVHRFFELLGTELNNQHLSRLEVTIIILIFVEIVLTFLTDVLHYV